MNTIYYDSAVSDELRRQMLYQGQLFVYTPRPSTIEFCTFARQLIEEVFKGLDPRTAQDHISVEKYAQILGELKPKFIHHLQSKASIQALLREMGCDAEKTDFDVPRMRSSTSRGYLTSGIAYAWHPHRDTWYSAPACQVNWWIPIYDITSDNVMAFHPRYWAQAVRNDSAQYDYEEWNKHHRYAACSVYQERPTASSAHHGTDGPGYPCAVDLSVRRDRSILRGTNAFERTEYVWPHPFQYRLPDRPPR